MISIDQTLVLLISWICSILSEIKKTLGIFKHPICKIPFKLIQTGFKNKGWKQFVLHLPLGSNDKAVTHGILMHPCPKAFARRIAFLRTRGKFRVTHSQANKGNSRTRQQLV